MSTLSFARSLARVSLSIWLSLIGLAIIGLLIATPCLVRAGQTPRLLNVRCLLRIQTSTRSE